MKKFNSIPESEPLYTKLKARSIKTSTIKDKEEKKYWNKLKKLHAIPPEYLSTREIMAGLEKFTKEKKI